MKSVSFTFLLTLLLTYFDITLHSGSNIEDVIGDLPLHVTAYRAMGLPSQNLSWSRAKISHRLPKRSGKCRQFWSSSGLVELFVNLPD